MRVLNMPLFGSVRVEASEFVSPGMLIVCRNEEVLNIIPAERFKFLAKFGLCPDVPIEANRFILDPVAYEKVMQAVDDARA